MKTITTLLVTVGAAAANANLLYIGTDGGQAVDITYFGNARSVFAGRLSFQNTLTSTNLATYCVDLDNTISGGQSWNCTPMMASSVSFSMKMAGRIVANAYGAADTDEEKAGLQLALWEAVYDYPANGDIPNFSSGNLTSTASATVLGHATSFYAGLTLSGDAIYYRPDPLNAGQAQIGPVPEPATMIALGAGAAALLRRRRK